VRRGRRAWSDDREQWRALVNTVSIKRRKFLDRRYFHPRTVNKLSLFLSVPTLGCCDNTLKPATTQFYLVILRSCCRLGHEAMLFCLTITGKYSQNLVRVKFFALACNIILMNSA
jgi:hypothetical protein